VIVGDETALHPGETALVHVEVIGGSGRVVRLLGPDGVLAETFVASDRFIYEYRIEHSAALPPFVRADLIQPLDPEVDLAAEPGALWVDAMTNPIWLLSRPAPPPHPAE
jgi:hypothetical protein